MKGRKRGFTLVEILITIAITGILAGTLLLSAGNSIDRASAARVTEEMNTIRTAVQMYMADHGNRWPNNLDGLRPYLDRDPYSGLGGYAIENQDDQILWLSADLNDRGVMNSFAFSAERGSRFFQGNDHCSPYKGNGPVTVIAARKGKLPPCDISLTPLGNDFFEIVEAMSSRMMDYYSEEGSHVSTWKDSRFSDIGLDLGFWKDQSVDGLIYEPHGQYVKVEPADESTVIRVTTVGGETKDLTSNLNWNIWIDVETGTGYYHNYDDPDEQFEVDSVEIIRK